MDVEQTVSEDKETLVCPPQRKKVEILEAIVTATLQASKWIPHTVCFRKHKFIERAIQPTERLRHYVLHL